MTTLTFMSHPRQEPESLVDQLAQIDLIPPVVLLVHQELS